MTITLRGLAVIAALALSAPFPAAAANEKIEFCHATGSETNPYVLIETSTAAFYNSGHVDHEGDIYPAGSHRDQSWPAQGDQSILAAGCEVTPTEEPSPTPTPTPTETPSTPTPTLPTPTLPTPTVTETVSPPTVTPTPSTTPSTPVETPTTPAPTKTPTQDEPEVTVKTEHVYTCTSHTAIRYRREGSGPWVEVSREVRMFPNTCGEGQTALQAIREEGL